MRWLASSTYERCNGSGTDISGRQRYSDEQMMQQFCVVLERGGAACSRTAVGALACARAVTVSLQSGGLEVLARRSHGRARRAISRAISSKGRAAWRGARDAGRARGAPRGRCARDATWTRWTRATWTPVGTRGLFSCRRPVGRRPGSPAPSPSRNEGDRSGRRRRRRSSSRLEPTSSRGRKQRAPGRQQQQATTRTRTFVAACHV